MSGAPTAHILCVFYQLTKTKIPIFDVLVARSPLRRIITSDVTSSANLAIAFSVSLFVISTAWMFYRPMMGAGLLMAAVSPFLYHTMGFFNIAQNQNGYYNR